ncbi:MAG TPA: hypothetical protein DEB06_06540 [Phycisphaerales bacterium]|nr:hypothetical protein [Phycisphaerales bacterium]
MKTKAVLSLVVGLLAGASFLPGCATQAERARSTARSSATDFQRSLEGLPSRIENTLTSLNQVTAGNNTNRAASFREFSQALQFQQDAATRLGRQADAAQANSQEFFRQYIAQAMASRDPAARQNAMDSLAGRQDAVNSALRFLNDGRNQYREFAGTLRDLQNDLRVDLSQASIDRLTPRVQAAIRQGTDLRNYIDRLDEQLNAVLNIAQ